MNTDKKTPAATDETNDLPELTEVPEFDLDGVAGGHHHGRTLPNHPLVPRAPRGTIPNGIVIQPFPYPFEKISSGV